MQARRSKTFATEHIVILALAFALLAAALIAVFTGATPSIRGNGRAEMVQPAAANPVTLQPAIDGLDAGITATSPSNSVPQLYGLGIGFDPGLVSSATNQPTWRLGVGLDAGFTDTVTAPRTWGLGVGFDAGLTDAAEAGGNTVRQLPGPGIGFDPGLTSAPAVDQRTGYGIGPTEH